MLDDGGDLNPFARTPLLVEGAVRAHWRSVLKIGRGYDQRADLTRRFIKAPTRIIVILKDEDRKTPHTQKT